MKLITTQQYVTVTDNVATGHAVRNRRLRKGLTLAKVSHRTGVSVAHLSRLELGGRTWTQPLLDRVIESLRDLRCQ